MPELKDEPHHSQPAPPSSRDDHAHPLASAVRVVSGLTLLSRLAGLARDLVHARLMGDSAVGSAFMAAWAIPNLFRRLFGEGALSAAFVPEYAQLVENDRELADRFASVTLAWLALLTGSLLLAGEAVLLVLLLGAGHDPDRALSLRLIMLTLPYMPLVCVAAIVGGMLQSHGRFAPTAAAPIILNVLVIGAAVPFFLADRTEAMRTQAAYVIGVAAVVAGALQAAWSLGAMRGRIRWRRTLRGAGEPMRRLLRRFLPVVIGMGTIQLNAFIDTVIAMWPVWFGPSVLGYTYPLDESSNSVLAFTQRLYQFPLGVFGIAVATAVFPLLSRHAGDPGRFLGTLRRGLRLSFFIGLPASLGLMLVRGDLTYVMYGGGASAFSDEGIARAAAVLLGYAPGVWAYSLNHVVTRAFYASGDTRTPMRVALWMVALNLVLNCTLIWRMGEAGLAWSTSITATLQLVLLTRASRRLTQGPAIDRETLGGLGRTVGASLLMAGAVLVTLLALGGAESWSGSLLRLVAAVGTGGGAYAAAAVALRQQEFRWLIERSRPKGPA
ncbi:MAG TPA: murein biosynthesis integral membrane protein MurJ [Phycisphaerales bacterium]|nr:murein biosynthesis integral membrane protein MurJ [Phycisphaerales bacterium]